MIIQFTNRQKVNIRPYIINRKVFNDDINVRHHTEYYQIRKTEVISNVNKDKIGKHIILKINDVASIMCKLVDITKDNYIVDIR